MASTSNAEDNLVDILDLNECGRCKELHRAIDSVNEFIDQSEAEYEKCKRVLDELHFMRELFKNVDQWKKEEKLKRQGLSEEKTGVSKPSIKSTDSSSVVAGPSGSTESSME